MINLEIANALPIPVLRVADQVAVAGRWRRNNIEAQQLRDAVRRQIDLLRERRQALITAAVTGEIDVSTASGRGVSA